MKMQSLNNRYVLLIKMNFTYKNLFSSGSVWSLQSYGPLTLQKCGYAVIIFHVRFARIAHIFMKYRIIHEDVRKKNAQGFQDFGFVIVSPF